MLYLRFALQADKILALAAGTNTRSIEIIGSVVLSIASALCLPGIANADGQRDLAPVIEVFKTPTCNCCRTWVKYLEASHFLVHVHNVRELQPVRAEHGVPESLAACHTAIVGGYVIEGHVSVSEIRSLLDQRPEGVIGLVVRGMPRGAPGMESPDPERYEVLSFDANGNTSLVATYDPTKKDSNETKTASDD